MRIAIVVHGRFHAFDLAKALIRRGHHVSLFTNYFNWEIKRFGVRGCSVHSFWLHRLLFGWSERIPFFGNLPGFEKLLCRTFGLWAAARLRKERWDLVHCWSGISEEILRDQRIKAGVKLLMRGSSHIRAQENILREERTRTGLQVKVPSPWILAREEREYALADHIRVLSEFAYNTFIKQGVSPRKIVKIPSGAPIETFRPSPEIVEARLKRIRSPEPLRVLYVGSLSFQKGLWDLKSIFSNLDPKKFRMRIIGAVAPEAKIFLSKHALPAEYLPHQFQERLPEFYAWGDLFLFPTLQDGYSQVLAQAYTSALIVLATTHCNAPELIQDGKTGWILPPRAAEVFLERLRWCDAHREELEAMVQRIYRGGLPRDWEQVSREIEAFTEKLKEE